MTQNWKDTLSTICGILIALCTALLTLATIPTWLQTACGITIAVAGALIGWITGKNPNLSTKTDTQVTNANTGK